MGNKSQKTKNSKPAPKRQVRGYPCCATKAFYASPADLIKRIPELQPLCEKTVAVFGLGCLGAPSVLEFARANVGRLRLVDYDIVDPASTVRWPIGFTVAGHKKTIVLQNFIHLNYPYTECKVFDFRVGSVRGVTPNRPPDQELIKTITEDVDLIYDSTGEWGVQHFLTDYAWEHKIPYIGLSGTLGAWGGKVFRIRPWDGTGCWCCYRTACDEDDIPEPPSAPDEQGRGRVQPVGCADPTFTGAGFDMLQVALMGVKMGISTLCEGAANAYPPIDWDVVHIRLRSEDGSIIPPTFDTYNLSPYAKCKRCHGNPR